jgi:hypothetical protein
MEPKIALMVITDGRYDYLHQTMESATKNLIDIFYTKIMVDDNPVDGSDSYLRKQFSDFEVVRQDKKLGLAGAVQLGWYSIPEEVDYIFHLEEDFIFNTKINPYWLVSILELHPYLSQVILKRQPWSAEEIEAGGYIEMNPQSYIDHDDGTGLIWWLEHRLFFSLNPGVYRKSITRDSWPNGNEAEFTAILNADMNNRFGVFGKRNDPPRITHIGGARSPDWKL